MDIDKGNIIVVNFMGFIHKEKASRKHYGYDYKDSVDAETVHSNKPLKTFKDSEYGIMWDDDEQDKGFEYNTYLNYNSSWNSLMPVVRRIAELCHASDADELFMSDVYTSILDTVSSAIIEDSFKVVVEFIEWYNKRK